MQMDASARKRRTPPAVVDSFSPHISVRAHAMPPRSVVEMSVGDRIHREDALVLPAFGTLM